VSPRRRLDDALVRTGAVADLDAARDLIAQGRVRVGGGPALNPARAVGDDEPIAVEQPTRFVGRGGEKLDAALERFAIDPTGWLVLDVGSSTGGFSDCLLQRGAARVAAVDVGRGQLHERLAADPRVISMERTNVLDLDAAAVSSVLGAPPQLATVDVSFTSLQRVVGHVLSLCMPEATLVALVKPQFETDRATASRGRGVVRDPEVWRAVLSRCASAIERTRAGIIGAMASPIRGAAGNAEFLFGARRGTDAASAEQLAAWIDAAVRDAGGDP
jgi:23S rRNA (cytidine1920-2'-O)/16S rRNA (cytidine1409-2'-O)-methyltransferase